MFDIKENLKKLPDTFGVYIHRDELGEVIYVGKAISLKKRVAQYFQDSKKLDDKVRAMVGHIKSFEYIKCGNEMEALVLENNLIKKYQPKYNILLRDDKTYPYIKITNERWPRIEKTRQMIKDGSKYYGPFSDVKATNNIVQLLSSVYRIKKCKMKIFPRDFRPCLNYHINRCNAMCVGKENHDDYMQRIEQIHSFLRGKSMDLISFLHSKMMEYSENLLFEKAATYRDYIESAKSIMEKQRVVLSSDEDIDVVLKVGDRNIAVFNILSGKLSGRETFDMGEMASDTEDSQVISAFIKQFFSRQTQGAKEILVDVHIDESKLIEEMLSMQWKHRVKLTRAVRGEKKDLLDMAKQDAYEMLKTIDTQNQEKKNRKDKLHRELLSLAKMSYVCKEAVSEIINSDTGEIISLFIDTEENTRNNEILRIEAYDISNMGGKNIVGAMVVFDELNKNKRAYRKFKIKELQGQDDYAGIKEMITRRINRALQGDVGFLPLPDIILVDGGIGHLNIALDIVNRYKLPISVFGMKKDNKHRSESLVYKDKNCEVKEINLRKNSFLFAYIGKIQEEVHRFAIEYHKNIRDKGYKMSILDDIKGIGEKKRNILLSTFGSVENIKSLSEIELARVKGITKQDAKNIKEFFLKGI